MKNILFIIDHIDGLNWKRDSSLLFAYHGHQNGNKIYFCYINDIHYLNKTLLASCKEIKILDLKEKKYEIGESENMQMDLFQMIFIRKNPPFDNAYLTVTHLLSYIDKKKTLIINNPEIFQKSSEKILTLNFKEFIPETLITNNFIHAKEFYNEHGDIILKPMYNYSSNDVFLIKQHDMNFRFIFDNLIQKYYNCHMFVQKFIKNVKKGDKRVLIVDGKILGSFLRIPSEDSILSGTVYGSRLELSELNEKEQSICNKVIEFLKHNNIYFVGLDIIDGYLTEINFTSPTGIPILSELTNKDYGKVAWDMVENIYLREISDG